MNEYRSPEERAAENLVRARVGAVLDEAIRNGSFMRAAMDLHEDPDVVERWINNVWNGLRRDLDDEDRLLAIVMLLERHMKAGARELRAVPDVRPRPPRRRRRRHRLRAALTAAALAVLGAVAWFAATTIIDLIKEY